MAPKINPATMCICGHAQAFHHAGKPCDECPCFKFRSVAANPEMYPHRVLLDQANAELAVRLFDEDCARIMRLHYNPTVTRYVQ